MSVIRGAGASKCAVDGVEAAKCCSNCKLSFHKSCVKENEDIKTQCAG